MGRFALVWGLGFVCAASFAAIHNDFERCVSTRGIKYVEARAAFLKYNPAQESTIKYLTEQSDSRDWEQRITALALLGWTVNNAKFRELMSRTVESKGVYGFAWAKELDPRIIDKTIVPLLWEILFKNTDPKLGNSEANRTYRREVGNVLVKLGEQHLVEDKHLLFESLDKKGIPEEVRTIVAKILSESATLSAGITSKQLLDALTDGRNARQFEPLAQLLIRQSEKFSEDEKSQIIERLELAERVGINETELDLVAVKIGGDAGVEKGLRGLRTCSRPGGNVSLRQSFIVHLAATKHVEAFKTLWGIILNPTSEHDARLMAIQGLRHFPMEAHSGKLLTTVIEDRVSSEVRMTNGERFRALNVYGEIFEAACVAGQFARAEQIRSEFFALNRSELEGQLLTAAIRVETKMRNQKLEKGAAIASDDPFAHRTFNQLAAMLRPGFSNEEQIRALEEIAKRPVEKRTAAFLTTTLEASQLSPAVRLKALRCTAEVAERAMAQRNIPFLRDLKEKLKVLYRGDFDFEMTRLAAELEKTLQRI